jgi:hypothetical protein
MRNLSVFSLHSADGHDVDPVDAFRLVLHPRLDAAYQRLDPGAVQAIVDVNPGDDPYPARTDKGEQELANGGHARVPEDKGSYSFLLSWPERLGEAGDIAALRPAAGARPGADQEVVAARGEPEAERKLRRESLPIVNGA